MEGKMILELASKEGMFLLCGLSSVAILRSGIDRFFSKWEVPIWKRLRFFLAGMVLAALSLTGLSLSLAAMHWYAANFNFLFFCLWPFCAGGVFLSFAAMIFASGLATIALVFSPFDLKWE